MPLSWWLLTKRVQAHADQHCGHMASFTMLDLSDQATSFGWPAKLSSQLLW